MLKFNIITAPKVPEADLPSPHPRLRFRRRDHSRRAVRGDKAQGLLPAKGSRRLHVPREISLRLKETV